METQIMNGKGSAVAVFNLFNFDLINDGQWQCIRQRHRMSEREVAVAKLICQGFSNEEIAKNLDITYGTVKVHIRNIYQKAGVHNKIAMLLKFISEIAKTEPGAESDSPAKKTFAVSRTC